MVYSVQQDNLAGLNAGSLSQIGAEAIADPSDISTKTKSDVGLRNVAQTETLTQTVPAIRTVLADSKIVQHDAKCSRGVQIEKYPSTGIYSS